MYFLQLVRLFRPKLAMARLKTEREISNSQYLLRLFALTFLSLYYLTNNKSKKENPKPDCLTEFKQVQVTIPTEADSMSPSGTVC